MSTATTITVSIALPWWTSLFVRSVSLFALTFGLEPDIDRMTRFIVRHARVTTRRAPVA